MKRPTIPIPGATGRIGGALIEELLPRHAAGRLELLAAVHRPEVMQVFLLNIARDQSLSGDGNTASL